MNFRFFFSRVSGMSFDQWLFSGMTLILLFNSTYYHLINYLQLICVLLLLIRPTFQKMPYLWGGIFISQLYFLFTSWHLLDNHHFLIITLNLTTLCYLFHQSKEAVLFTFRFLISGIMFMAVFYKLKSFPEFGSGHFLYYTSAIDPRFFLFTSFLEVPREDIIRAIENVSLYEVGKSKVEIMTSPVRGLLIFKVMEWFVLLLELLIAFSFLPFLKMTPFLSKLRLISLTTFILVLYSVTPIIGFAHCFCLMGGTLFADKKPLFLLMGLLSLGVMIFHGLIVMGA